MGEDDEFGYNDIREVEEMKDNGLTSEEKNYFSEVVEYLDKNPEGLDGSVKHSRATSTEEFLQRLKDIDQGLENGKDHIQGVRHRSPLDVASNYAIQNRDDLDIENEKIIVFDKIYHAVREGYTTETE